MIKVKRYKFHFLEWLKHILWPEICPFCGKASAQGICSSCQEKIDNLVVMEPRCMKCGKPLNAGEEEYCRACSLHMPIYDRGVSLWIYTQPVDISIYHFKFHNQRHFKDYYGPIIVKKYGFLFYDWNPDFILPIPLHKTRMKKRGFNQSYLLAQEIARNMNRQYKDFRPIVTDHILLRTKKTKPQKQLNYEERKENIEHAFSLNQSYIEMLQEHDKMNQLLMGKTVLIIDDIFTTGSTIEAVAEVLKRHGVKKVYFFTLSTGIG